MCLLCYQRGLILQMYKIAGIPSHFRPVKCFRCMYFHFDAFGLTPLFENCIHAYNCADCRVANNLLVQGFLLPFYKVVQGFLSQFYKGMQSRQKFSKAEFLSQFCNAGFPFTVFQSRVSFLSFAMQGFLSQFFKAGFPFTVLQSSVSNCSFEKQGLLSQFCKAGFPCTVLQIRGSFHSFEKQGFL